MTEISSAYQVAEHIHDTVWLRNKLITEEDLAQGRIRADYGLGGTQQVVAFSDTNDPSQPRYETLSRLNKGLYYLHVTAGPEYNGDRSLGRHVIKPDSAEDMAIRLADSLLVKELFRVAINSQE